MVSIYTFVPPPGTAQANAKVLEEWNEELKDIDVNSLPPELQEKAVLFKKILAAKPFDVHGLPDIYAAQFRNLPETRPENHGYLTFIYPQVDLWDGKKMLAFNDQVATIKTASGAEYHAAGAPILYAKLARIVLSDGRLTLILTTIWILLMHFLDFRSVSLALASVIPLVVGLFMMLGMLSLMNARLNFMNIVILPILLGFGVSHGLYLLHRFLEGTSPIVAFRSVGAAVASSTLTAIAGFAALFAASHNGLKSMGLVACLGLATTLRRLVHRARGGAPDPPRPAGRPGRGAPGPEDGRHPGGGMNRALVGVLALGTLAGCAATVKQHTIRPDYAQVDRTKTKRLLVVTSPNPNGDAKLGELWSTIARRYANQKRDFIAKESRPAPEGAEGSFSAASQCAEGFEGVLWLQPTAKQDGDKVKTAVHAELVRCTDGQQVWSADAAHTYASKDDQLKETIAQYVTELGADRRAVRRPELAPAPGHARDAPRAEARERRGREREDRARRVGRAEPRDPGTSPSPGRKATPLSEPGARARDPQAETREPDLSPREVYSPSITCPRLVASK